MNTQRETIYSQRLKVLSGEDVSGNILSMMIPPSRTLSMQPLVSIRSSLRR